MVFHTLDTQSTAVKPVGFTPKFIPVEDVLAKVDFLSRPTDYSIVPSSFGLTAQDSRGVYWHEFYPESA